MDPAEGVEAAVAAGLVAVFGIHSRVAGAEAFGESFEDAAPLGEMVGRKLFAGAACGAIGVQAAET